jgi:thiol-disulfide isomerase/thioredoxin
MSKTKSLLRLGDVIAACAMLAILISTSCTLPTSLIKAEGNSSIMAVPQDGRVRAPELTGGRGWLNTDKPLSLAALKGKFVLLDFWTYGCINCIHIIPDLKRLEEKYAKQLVVIGVHSAKFDNEKDTENIRRIVVRYEIEHPVVNDADFSIWQSYGVRAWPTQVLIDPAGYVMGAVSGEGNYQVIDKAITAAVEEFRRRGELNEQPLNLALERARVGDLPLAFPGKVLADAKSDRLFIADSNHNRIVVTRLDGTLLETIGTGTPGQADGAYERATFYRPQGMALDGESLYVADTENHLIRRINLKSKMVETVAGTGKQSREYYQSGAARTIALNSPWDLQIVGRSLFIAMAGPHQIWKLDPDKNEVSTFAGSGREGRIDGLLMMAGFAQPSGLASDGKTLYVADSEANILRGIKLTEGEVQTVAGGDLFEFGDRDGVGDEVRFQHPLGLAIWDERVLIADTYNHKVKSFDPKSGSVKSLFGTGKPGQADGATPSFYEPGGLSVANGKLFIADTNNHAIRVVDLKSGQTSTLMLKNLAPPDADKVPAEETATGPNSEEIVLAPQRIRATSDGSLTIDVVLPAGYHLNPSAPQRYRISVEKGMDFLSLTGAKAGAISQTSKDLKFPLKLPLRAQKPGQADLRIQTTLFYCREDNTGTCQIKTLVWRAPVEIISDKTAPTELKATATIR